MASGNRFVGASAAIIVALAMTSPAIAADNSGEPDVSWVKAYPKWIRDRQAEVPKRMGAKKYKEAMCALKNETRQPEVDSKPGPQVWVEEYWDVKPEKWNEFRAAYEKEVYA